MAIKALPILGGTWPGPKKTGSLKLHTRDEGRGMALDPRLGIPWLVHTMASL